MIWLVFAVLTGVVVIAVLWPLVRARHAVVQQDADIAFYEAQIAEIGRDAERELISAEDAARAKAEAARRLIAVGDDKTDSSAEKPGVATARSKASVWRRAIAAGFAVVFIPAVAFGMYRLVGNPDLPDEPLTARLNDVPGHSDMAAALTQLEQHLAQNPDDGAGWELVAPIYLNIGRADDAVKAYANSIRLLGATPERREAYGGALVFAANGKVTPEARDTFKAALAENPKLPQARFFVGLAAEQDGDKASAIDTWTKLLADAPADAEWTDFVRQKIVADGGQPPSSPASSSAAPTAPGSSVGATASAPAAAGEGQAAPVPAATAAQVAAEPEDQQQKFIHDMVDGLAARLHQNGQDVEGWLRLVRAYTVLQENDKARAALADARKNLGSDAAAMGRLDQLAHELGLEG